MRQDDLIECLLYLRLIDLSLQIGFGSGITTPSTRSAGACIPPELILA